jgi:hypothetical protein
MRASRVKGDVDEGDRAYFHRGDTLDFALGILLKRSGQKWN